MTQTKEDHHKPLNLRPIDPESQNRGLARPALGVTHPPFTESMPLASNIHLTDNRECAGHADAMITGVPSPSVVYIPMRGITLSMIIYVV